MRQWRHLEGFRPDNGIIRLVLKKSFTPSMKTRLKEGKLKVAKLVRREAETTAQVRDKSDFSVRSSAGDGET